MDLGEDSGEVIRDGVVRETENPEPEPAKYIVSLAVRTDGVVVHGAIHLYDQPQCMAVEINDESRNHLLPPEPTATDLPLSQDPPKASLGECRPLAHLFRPLLLHRLDKLPSHDSLPPLFHSL